MIPMFLSVMVVWGVFFIVFSCPQEGVTYFPFSVECFSFFSVVLQITSCKAMSPFGLQLTHLHWKLWNELSQLLEKLSE